jgi:hypothetical protein
LIQDMNKQIKILLGKIGQSGFSRQNRTEKTRSWAFKI